MNRIFGLAALVGFIISLIVHISALLNIDVLMISPYVWLLHLGIFVVFVPFVFSSRKTLGTKPKLAEIRAVFPAWVVVIGICILAYVVLNFALFMMATKGGSPSVQDGKYLLLNHGKLIRELTFAEYTAFRTNEIRGFSGHWLVFYFVPFAYFTFRKQPTLVQ
jgi:hypothetical protein